MKHKVGEIRKLWVYNEDTGSLASRNLVFRLNAVESWYEDTMTNMGHDPYYVDVNKRLLTNRVIQCLNRELMETLTAAKELTKRLKRLANAK